MKFYTKEWTDEDFKKVEKAILNEFAGKSFINHNGKIIDFLYNYEDVEYILGLPYTSSGIHPQIALDCNTNIFQSDYRWDGYHYDYVTLDENKNVVFVLSDKQENHKYIIKPF